MTDDDRGGYGFPAAAWRTLDRHPPPGVKRVQRWRSPLRGPWLTSVFGAVLLVTLPVVTITGLLSYIAYAPQLGQAIPGDVGWLKLPTFDWPTDPSWLYRLNQGLHVGLGLILIPVVLAKLWSVIPRLFVWPPSRSIAQVLERVSLLMLVGGILFEIVTGVLNIQYDYIFGFSFYTAHYYGAWVFIAGFVVHVAIKAPRMWSSLRSRSMREVLRTSREDTVAEPHEPDGLVSSDPAPATLSRRGALALVGGGATLVACSPSVRPSAAGPATRRCCCRAAAASVTAPTTSRSTEPRSRPGSTPRTPATAGGSPSPAARNRSCWIAPRSAPCPSTPRYYRSPASRDGRPRRRGQACGCATSRSGPGWPNLDGRR